MAGFTEEISVNESNMRHCKRCSELKTRIDAGKYPDSRNKKYVDENGKSWSGNTCPSCFKDKMKHGMKKMRFTRKIVGTIRKEEEWNKKEDEDKTKD